MEFGQGGGVRGEGSRFRVGHTLFVLLWYLEGLCVCVNYILAQILIEYLMVSFPGGRVDGGVLTKELKSD